MEKPTRYIHKNRRKFDLKVHIVLVSKFRRKIFYGQISNSVKEEIYKIAQYYNFQIVTMETDLDHIHILLSYDTTMRVSDIVKTIKQLSAYAMWSKFPLWLSRFYWKKHLFWSDGYFACSIGEVSEATIKKYIESQG